MTGEVHTVEAGDDGAADVVPDAEDGAGDDGHGIGGKVEGGQAGGESAVLHAHLDAQGAALGCGKVQQAGNEIAHGEPSDVVEHDHGDDEQSAGHQALGAGGNDDEHDGANGDGRQGRQIGRGLLRLPWPQPFHQQADDDGQYDHPEDAEEHGGHIDIDRLARQEPDEQGREHWCQECGDARHADTQGQVATGQIGDDIRRRAAGTAAHEHHTDGEGLVKLEQPRQRPSQQRHHGELRRTTDKHVSWAAEHHAEVIKACRT